MRTTVAIAGLGLLLFAGDGRAARRTTECCVTITDATGARRPYCFNLVARTRRIGRRLCRLVGGSPRRPGAR